ncbi:hypothetical protein DV738_g4611, partial [Chaetothyriales sp. CBS 135597]
MDPPIARTSESRPGPRLKLVVNPRAAPEHNQKFASPDRGPSYSPVTPTESQGSEDPPDHVDWIDHPPPSQPVDLDQNTDAMAMRAAISILQLQRQQAIKDMKDLEQLKRAALNDPDAFIKDLNEGQPSDGRSPDTKFGRLPAAQQVVRAPPIEWAKYHIVGEPLDRMHELQRAYPGVSPDTLKSSQKLQPHSIASPYRPFTDKLDASKSPP